VHGTLEPLDAPPLQPADTARLIGEVATAEEQAELEQNGGTDFGYPFEDLARFRVSIFRQRGMLGMVMRLIPSRLMSLEEIGLPAQLKELLFKPRGLILVTGPTGSGKTTTLASMIDVINRERSCHILTVEDPIEYYHSHKRSMVTQREVGSDVPSFSEALKRGLRQDPDVILVGEMRDLETISAAIRAAETGHLVLATLHTTGADTTINRIVDAFPPDHQNQVRQQIASSIRAVISQILLPRADRSGRIAAFETLVQTQSVSTLIRDQKTHQLRSVLQTGARLGMQDLDSHLLKLYREGLIREEDVLASSRARDELARQMG
jgi:twitching motility protein PilT